MFLYHCLKYWTTPILTDNRIKLAIETFLKDLSFFRIVCPTQTPLIIRAVATLIYLLWLLLRYDFFNIKTLTSGLDRK